MRELQLNDQQQAIVQAGGKIFLDGAAGTGKTTAASVRLRHLLDSSVPAESILLLIPQRTLALPYDDLLDDPQLAAGGQVQVTTLGGLARRGVDLFWPVIAEPHGFQQPEQRPTFLSLETAQYFMARVVGPVIDQELLFDAVTIDRNRLYSQLIDNLNKAAVIGFPYAEIGERLKQSTTDEVKHKIYDDVQRCANLFRDYCLEHNLLDFSLQVELLVQQLWDFPAYQNYLRRQYAHLIFDNVEEDTPATHFITREMLGWLDSALLVMDTTAGYRRFLGADPKNAAELSEYCDEHVQFKQSFVVSPSLFAFSAELAHSLNRNAPDVSDDPRDALRYDSYKYHPEMIDGVAERIAALVHNDGVDPNEIVVLAPYLSDALRFSLMNRLGKADVPVRSHRPSRSLREEPAAQALLTLAKLAHPTWTLETNYRVTRFDVVYALKETIAELDLVRAQLMARYGFDFDAGRLQPFDTIKPETQGRITYLFGQRYERLREWLDNYMTQEEPLELDHFFSRLFGEVLSQPGFGFHDDFDAAKAAANLVDSARRFRRIIAESGAPPQHKPLAQEYIEMVGSGVIADQYLRGWDIEDEAAVLLAPAYTFLMTNRPVDYQFWLNVGGRGWADRLYQPLTNPYVLSLQWPQGMPWTDEDEVLVANEALYALTLGLIRRCRKQIYLGFSELGEQGHEQRGELLSAVQRMLKRLADAT